MPRTEIEEEAYQKERSLDVLLQELRDLQIRHTSILNEIHTIRYSRDRTPNLGYALAGIGPRDTTDNNLHIGDTVKLKNYRRFRATTGKIVKITDKRVIVELPSGQTTNRAHHNLRKL